MSGFDESLHSRDERGRFSSGGGGGIIGGGKLSTWADKRSGGKGESLKKEESSGKRVWTDKLPSWAKHDETWKTHFDKSPWEGGKPSAERQKLHDAISKDALDKPGAYPKPGEHKMAIFTMGAPASGKSSAMKAFDEKHFVKVDPDAIKEQMPEYKKSMDPKNTYRGAAAMVHEESSHLSQKIREQAMKNGQHMIVDGTGVNSKALIEKMEAAKAAGYHVHLVMPHLEKDEGMKRMESRAEKVGRFVPTHIVEDAYQKVPRNFDEISKHSDSFAMHDASKEGTPMVWSKDENGKESHQDEGFVKNFKDKYGSAA